MKGGRRQRELFPPAPHRWQTLAELDAIGVRLAGEALELHAACAADPRAARACFNAMVMFGTVEVLRRRGQPEG